MAITRNSNNGLISDWYDGFSAHQVKLGINIRHRTILRNARNAGLRDGSRVLEIGCGIGTVTSLLAKAVPNGRILAVDISPKSIEIASQNLRKYGQVEFLVSDMRDFEVTHRYDLVVLPDVIEHIPLVDHARLFATIARHMAPDGRVLINVPNAELLEYLHVHDPSVLQVLDQPVHLDRLITTTYAAGLVLESLTSYGLQFAHVEYHSIVLRPAFSLDGLVRKGKWSLRWAELRSRLPW
ncbi:MAG: methyltransferase domain-containing protein [Flavobacteriales bacterium]|nr:methyltransferase domain-containing protein [Flavobacteriales bacterium]